MFRLHDEVLVPALRHDVPSKLGENLNCFCICFHVVSLFCVFVLFRCFLPQIPEFELNLTLTLLCAICGATNCGLRECLQ